MDFHPEETTDSAFDGFDYQQPSAEQSFEGSFPSVMDEGFVSPPPTVKKERRYSGMEIPFGVIEAGSNVTDVNPMRNSKRLSSFVLFPVVNEEVPSPEAAERSPTSNPLKVTRRMSTNPLSSRNKPLDVDDIPFGINETTDRVGSEINPMRTSGKFKMPPSPNASPKKPISGEIYTSQHKIVYEILFYLYCVSPFILFRSRSRH